MTVHIDNDMALQKIVSFGLIPSIEHQIMLNREGGQKLYETALVIGELVDTYHKVYRTGNSVECVQPVKD